MQSNDPAVDRVLNKSYRLANAVAQGDAGRLVAEANATAAAERKRCEHLSRTIETQFEIIASQQRVIEDYRKVVSAVRATIAQLTPPANSEAGQ